MGPECATVAPPITAARTQRSEAEACSCAHELMAGLAQDLQELSAAERAVAERRARVAALERELGEIGVGASDSGSSSDEGEDEDDESMEGEEGSEDGEEG